MRLLKVATLCFESEMPPNRLVLECRHACGALWDALEHLKGRIWSVEIDKMWTLKVVLSLVTNSSLV